MDSIREVSPRKLPGGKGWGVMVGPGGEVGAIVLVRTRRGKEWEAELVEEVTSGIWSTTETEAGSGATRQRLESKAQKREDWAESRSIKEAQALDQADLSEAKSGIPFGQPILVGHHSERRHRRIVERATRKGFESLEHHKAAARHGGIAKNITRQLEISIYDDDVNAAEKLRERITEREVKRDRIKAINRHVRSTKSYTGLNLTQAEARDLEMAALCGHDIKRGYPSYALSNLGGNIRRDKKRLARLLSD